MTFTPQTDFTGVGSTYDTTYTNFGVTVYKNYESLTGADAKFSDHIQNFIEMGCGAHYYSQGKYTTLYRKAEVTVNLSNVTVDTQSKRAAFICLSVVGVGACDMGLKNAGSGWFPFYYSGTTKEGGSGTVVSGAAKVKMLLETSRANSEDVLKITYTWYNSSGSTISTSGNNASMTYSATAGKLFTLSSGLPIHRFQRFMSLVPLDNNYSPSVDKADGSKLVGGNFQSPKLYLASGSSVTWGTSLMDYIWSVQGWNITSFTPGSTDSFSCAHTNYVY